MTEEQARKLIEPREDQRKATAAFLSSAQTEAIPFWELPSCKVHYVPVEGGKIRVLHVKARHPAAERPLVFVPGWGVIPEGFLDYYSVIHAQVDFYYVETREKSSSRLIGPKTDMSVSRNARDIQAALDALGLSRLDDFVLSGTCWGSASILQGLIERTLEAPTIVLADPMHTLWFPKWVLRYLSPITPIWAVNLLKPILRRSLVGDMKEPVQKRRADAFIDAADPRKWKRAADAARQFELYGRLAEVSREVFVFNGSVDKIHENINYPRMAAELPRGRFIFMPCGENDRERGMGVACLEFAKVGRRQGLPGSLAPFELPVR